MLVNFPFTIYLKWCAIYFKKVFIKTDHQGISSLMIYFSLHIWCHMETNYWPLILGLEGLVIGEVEESSPLFTNTEP